jgi:hypothetical protein
MGPSVIGHSSILGVPARMVRDVVVHEELEHDARGSVGLLGHLDLHGSTLRWSTRGRGVKTVACGRRMYPVTLGPVNPESLRPFA